MEFNYSDYLVRITFNPTDIIVRFEHNKTLRCYEQTFFERDFPQTSMMGGMKFLEKVLSAVFAAPKFDEIYIDKFAATSGDIKFQVVLNNPLFANPIVLPFELQAQRKSTGNIELSELNRKMKEMNDKMTKVLEEKLSAMDSLAERINELEGRCGNAITLQGCIFAIPINLTSLILVRDHTFLPDNRGFSSQFPQSSMSGQPNYGGISWSNPYSGAQQGYVNLNFTPDAFTHNGVICIHNLQYLTNCKQVTLSGCSDVKDFSPLGKMTWLTHLSIINSRAWNNTNNPMASGGNNPTLTDLKWIKSLKNLQSLTLLGCSQLSDITPLKDLPTLKELDIRETAVRNTDFLLNPNLKITK